MYSCESSRKSLEIQRFFIVWVQKEKNRNPDRLYQNYGSYLVEVRRVELLSKSRLTRLSTSVVNVLGFPSHNAHQQALRYGSL